MALDMAGKPLKIPGLFMISIPLFTAAEPTRLPVRLRYRKGPGGLTWAFSIYPKQQAFLAALQREAARASPSRRAATAIRPQGNSAFMFARQAAS